MRRWKARAWTSASTSPSAWKRGQSHFPMPDPPCPRHPQRKMTLTPFPPPRGLRRISSEAVIEIVPHGNVTGLAHVRAALGMRDLVMFCVVTGISVRWIGTAAAAGPSAITIWLGAFALFYLPLLAAVLELSSRFTEGDGGIYHWSQRALGDWSGFMTGWTYWTCNLPYYPSILLFAAGAAAYLISADAVALGANPTYIVGFSVAAMW